MSDGLRGQPDPVSAFRYALAWAGNHKWIVAVIAGLYAALKVGRWILYLSWTAGEWLGIGRVVDFLASHWLLAAAAVVATFALVVVVIRVGLGWYERRQARAAPETG